MTDTIRFLLNGEVCDVDDVDPTTTVLNYLRYALRETGTKEGCAEGDCGACTLVMGELQENSIRYRAVNACILFLPVLDGKEIITVEGLAAEDGTLHPVQQAMVDLHGSQCGFCTPGFVMSIYAHHLNGGATDPNSVSDAIAGNLCRCTGYGPILEAAASAECPAPSIHETINRVALLKSIQREDTLAVSGTCVATGVEKRYFAPSDLEALADLALQYPDATLLAGGTDVGLWVTKQHRTLTTVIYLGNVRELHDIQETESAIRFGAAASYTDCADLITRHYPDFGEIVRRLGSVQIRNSGTLGGNVANGSPIGDGMPPLIAAGASVVLRKGDAQRTLPMEEYFIDYGNQDRAPGEFVEAVILPRPPANQIFRAYKISKRFDQDISAVCGAFAFEVEDGIVTSTRIAFGGMAATPKRATNAEVALVGQSWREPAIDAAMDAMEQDFAPITDMRASDTYRLKVAKNLLMKAYLESVGDRISVLDEKRVANG